VTQSLGADTHKTPKQPSRPFAARPDGPQRCAPPCTNMMRKGDPASGPETLAAAHSCAAGAATARHTHAPRHVVRRHGSTQPPAWNGGGCMNFVVRSVLCCVVVHTLTTLIAVRITLFTSSRKAGHFESTGAPPTRSEPCRPPTITSVCAMREHNHCVHRAGGCKSTTHVSGRQAATLCSSLTAAAGTCLAASCPSWCPR